MSDVFIVAAKRTPIGKSELPVKGIFVRFTFCKFTFNFVGALNGSLASIPSHELGSTLIKNVISETKVAPEDVSEVILGQVLGCGQGQNPARQAALNAGLPNTVPAMGVNMVCGSGLRSVALAAQAIKCGDSNIVIAGGQESMSQAVHFSHLRNGIKFGNTEFKDSLLVDGLTDAFDNIHMGITAENVAKEFNIRYLGSSILNPIVLLLYDLRLGCRRLHIIDALSQNGNLIIFT